MSAPTIYPFSLRPDELDGGGAWSHPVARAVWLRIKEPGETWFAVKAIVTSRDSITIVVYGMADNVYGGLGDETLRRDAVGFRGKIRDMLDAEIGRQENMRAEQELDRRENQERLKRIAEIRREMFGAKEPQP